MHAMTPAQTDQPEDGMARKDTYMDKERKYLTTANAAAAENATVREMSKAEGLRRFETTKRADPEAMTRLGEEGDVAAGRPGPPGRP